MTAISESSSFRNRKLEYPIFNNFTIYDADDQKTLIKEICRKMNIDTKKVKERALLAQISHAKDELLTPDESR